MVFGIIAMILVGFSWIVWGYVGGEAPKRNLNVGLLLAISAAVAILLCLAGIAGVMICEKNGIRLHHVVHPAVPDLRNGTVILISALILFAGIFNFLQIQFMSRAMASGPNGIIWSFIQSGFIVPFALGVIFFDKPLTWAFASSLALVITGLVLFAVSADNGSANDNVKGKWLMMTFLSFIATCFCQSLQYLPSNFNKEVVDSVSSVWRTLCFFFGLLCGFAILYVVSSKTRSEIVKLLKNKYTWRYSLLIDAVEIVACCCLMYPGLDALADTPVSAMSMQLMTASGIVTFELYAVLILKEKRKPLQVIALMLCLASIVAICF